VHHRINRQSEKQNENLFPCENEQETKNQQQENVWQDVDCRLAALVLLLQFVVVGFAIDSGAQLPVANANIRIRIVFVVSVCR